MNFKVFGALLVLIGLLGAMASTAGNSKQGEIGRIEWAAYRDATVRGEVFTGLSPSDSARVEELRNEIADAKQLQYVSVGVALLGLIICISASATSAQRKSDLAEKQG